MTSADLVEFFLFFWPRQILSPSFGLFPRIFPSIISCWLSPPWELILTPLFFPPLRNPIPLEAFTFLLRCSRPPLRREDLWRRVFLSTLRIHFPSDLLQGRKVAGLSALSFPLFFLLRTPRLLFRFFFDGASFFMTPSIPHRRNPCPTLIADPFGLRFRNLKDLRTPLDNKSPFCGLCPSPSAAHSFVPPGPFFPPKYFFFNQLCISDQDSRATALFLPTKVFFFWGSFGRQAYKRAQHEPFLFFFQFFTVRRSACSRSRKPWFGLPLP